jgi:glutamate racemase
LVGEIEAARLDSPRTRRILETALTPMLAQNIDTLVLGCTHYPFVIPLIKQIVGPDVKVIDPAPAIARQTRRILAAQNLFHPQEKSGRIQILTTGEPGKLQQILPRLTKKISLPHSLRWQGESLI